LLEDTGAAVFPGTPQEDMVTFVMISFPTSGFPGFFDKHFAFRKRNISEPSLYVKEIGLAFSLKKEATALLNKAIASEVEKATKNH